EVGAGFLALAVGAKPEHADVEVTRPIEIRDGVADAANFLDLRRAGGSAEDEEQGERREGARKLARESGDDPGHAARSSPLPGRRPGAPRYTAATGTAVSPVCSAIQRACHCRSRLKADGSASAITAAFAAMLAAAAAAPSEARIEVSATYPARLD